MDNEITVKTGMYFFCVKSRMIVLQRGMRGNWWCAESTGDTEKDKTLVPSVMFRDDWILKYRIKEEVVDKIEEV